MKNLSGTEISADTVDLVKRITSFLDVHANEVWEGSDILGYFSIEDQKAILTFGSKSKLPGSPFQKGINSLLAELYDEDYCIWKQGSGLYLLLGITM